MLLEGLFKDLLAHELDVAIAVWVRVAHADLLGVILLDVGLEEHFRLFVKVVSDQIIDDADLVDPLLVSTEEQVA